MRFFLLFTQGKQANYRGHDVNGFPLDLDLHAVAYDRWRIDLLKRELDAIGVTLPLIPWGQGYRDMGPAIDALEAELLNTRIAHGNHPVLGLCAANAVITKDPAGSRKLDKSRATGRIDGMVAMAMAMGAAGAAEAPAIDPYASRGMIFI